MHQSNTLFKNEPAVMKVEDIVEKRWIAFKIGDYISEHSGIHNTLDYFELVIRWSD